jgi:hypothetical protein
MRMLRTVGTVAVCLMAFSTLARAELKKHPGAQIQFEVPDRWTQKQNKNALLIIDPKEEAMVIVRITSAKNVKALGDRMDEYIGEYAANVKWEPQQERDVNGMKGISIDGAGVLKSNGVPINLMCAFIVTPSSKIAMVLVIAESSKLERHARGLKKVLTTIAPLAE